MTTRTYQQTCAVARALDRLGDRWTWLIVRDLLIGPRRYTDLLSGLPGIGTNLLADRLKQLEDERVVSRVLTAGNTPGYTLTSKGRDLEPVVVAMARWGLKYPTEGGPDDFDRPEWTVVALRATFRPEEARGVRERYEFRIGETVFHANVDDGAVDTGLGPTPAPDLVWSCPPETFRQVLAGEVTVADARARKMLRVDGEDAVLDRMTRIFSPPMVET